MINYVKGNIFDSPAECIINPVNCCGVMGKGLALQFKNRYPRMFQDYRKACASGDLYIGSIHTFEENGKTIVNFPTKIDWRNKSRIEFIDAGMKALTNFLKEKDIKSVAIPPLGCGLSGLGWEEVKACIEKYLIDLEDIEIYLYTQ